MFEPSLLLLIFKTGAIFCFSLAAGWSINYKRFTDIPIINWTITTILGTAFLNFICLWAVLLNFPGWTGLIPVIILFLIKIVIVLYKKTIDYTLINKNLTNNIKKTILPIFLLSMISTFNYFSPFIAEGTSGYYSRGGGDHSTYLVLSDYYSKHSFWEKLYSTDIRPTPPKQHWEADDFAYNRMNLNPVNVQPYANQLIATPYMSFLPGANEETYSAVVAFYISMAMWSVTALGMLLLNRKMLAWWFFIPLFLSNVALYNATTHSIPYLLSLSLFNAIIMLFWIYTRNSSWQTNLNGYRYFLPLGIISATLMVIYPHGFFIIAIFISILALSSVTLEEFKRFITLGLMTVIFSFAVVNFILLTNIPLIFAALGWHDPFTIATQFSEILMAQTGITDLLSKAVINPWKTIIIGFFLLLIMLVSKTVLNAQARVRWLLITLFLIPWAAILYYYLRGGGSYQIVRFLELVHLYILGLAGFGLSYFFEKKRSLLISSSVTTIIVVFISLEITTHIHTIKDVLNVSPVFGTEFRDSKALIAIKKLQVIQESQLGINHIAYYFGPGDGVDFAGGSVFLRNLDYLPARGNTLESVFDNIYFPGRNTRVWEKAWLDHAYLIIRTEGDVDVIDDKRQKAFSEPFLNTSRLKIYDSNIQPLTQLIGDSWGALQFYPSESDSLRKPFRYLHSKTGAIVIWAQKKQQVHLSLFINSDTKDTEIKLHSSLINEDNKKYNVPKWESVIPSAPSVSLSLMLTPGANVIEVTPHTKNKTPPTLYIWKVMVI
jgi:hypothetical protein